MNFTMMHVMIHEQVYKQNVKLSFSYRLQIISYMKDGTVIVEKQNIYMSVFPSYKYFIITSRTQTINFVYYDTPLWHTCPFRLLICFETGYYQQEWVTIR
jgi:hypothetical protein